MRFGPVVLLSALLPSAAAASSFSGATLNNSCASHLTTCASVQVQYVRMGETTGPLLTLRGSWAPREVTPEIAIPSFRLTPSLTQGVSVGGPRILAIAWGDDGKPVVCRPGGADCRIDAVVTPEPVTMTLIATGLVGMAGASRLRRKQKKLTEV